MKEKTYKTGAIGAILDEYERAIIDLKNVLCDISDSQLTIIVDDRTTDEDCRSIQTIMAHVVSSAHNYAVYIAKNLGEDLDFYPKTKRSTSQEYIEDLDSTFQFNSAIFEKYPHIELETFDTAKKMLVRWGQLYDYEQILEHAIVHILRHRRQIERFKLLILNEV
jgi:uncharacterized damage-inducible protein DinB